MIRRIRSRDGVVRDIDCGPMRVRRISVRERIGTGETLDVLLPGDYMRPDINGWKEINAYTAAWFAPTRRSK